MALKDARLEIRINHDTKEKLQVIATHLTTTGTTTELLLTLVEETIEKHKKLLNQPIIK